MSKKVSYLTLVDGGKTLDAGLSSDFVVNKKTGEAFISQRKLAEMCGVSQQAISQRCLSQKYDVKQGVSIEIMDLLVTHYCTKGKQEAVQFMMKCAKAGYKAFIYHEAGCKMDAKPNQMTTMEMVAETAIAVVNLERTQAEINNRLSAIEAKQIVLEKSFHEFTIMAYYIYADIGDLDFRKANVLGLKVAKYCRSNGYPIGKQSDPRFGKVNSYPEHAIIDVLRAEGEIPE